MRRKVTEIPGTSMDVARSTSIESSLEINHVSWGLFPWPLLLLTISIGYLRNIDWPNAEWLEYTHPDTSQRSSVMLREVLWQTQQWTILVSKLNNHNGGPFQIIQNNMCITGIAYSWIYLTRTMPGISTTSNSIHDSLLKDRDGSHGGDSETAIYASENLRNLPARNGSEWWFQRKSHVNTW